MFGQITQAAIEVAALRDLERHATDGPALAYGLPRQPQAIFAKPLLEQRAALIGTRDAGIRLPSLDVVESEVGFCCRTRRLDFQPGAT